MTKWLFIGSGVIAHRVATQITNSKRHIISGVCSSSLARGESFAQKFNCRNFENLNLALQSKCFDAVYIATPHSSHYSILKTCIENNAAVLCEKPLTVNAHQAKEIFELSVKNGTYVCEGMWTRFLPVIKQVKEWTSGRIGKIFELCATFCYPYRLSGFSSRVIDPNRAGGALLDTGVYCISFAQLINSDVVEAKLIKTKIGKTGVDVFNKIQLKHTNGAISNIKCGIDRLSLTRATIFGIDGLIKIPIFFKPTKATISSSTGHEQCIDERGFIYEFDAVADDLKNNRTQNALCTHENTITTLEILDILREQAGIVYPKIIEQI